MGLAYLSFYTEMQLLPITRIKQGLSYEGRSPSNQPPLPRGKRKRWGVVWALTKGKSEYVRLNNHQAIYAGELERGIACKLNTESRTNLSDNPWWRKIIPQALLCD
jgi:hypothetical protein